jgi:uncharacterized phage infection (PIP) family protein YhgE
MPKKIIKKNNPTESSREDKMMVILEDMRDEIKIVAEGHSVLQNGIYELSKELGGELSNFGKELTSVKKELTSFRKEFNEFRNDTKDNFKILFEYLSRIDDEISDIKNELKNNYKKKGWDVKWRKAIEERVEKMEKMMKGKDFSMNILRDK